MKTVTKTTLAAALLLALGAAGAAHAAFPGANGKLVFRSNRTGNADIYTSNADGTDRVDLTRDPAEDVDPRWSPDGTQIVFASNRTGSFQLYTMNADGTGLHRVLSMAGDARRPSWTPDGRILFQSDAADPGVSRDIYVVDADGTGLTDLTPDSRDELNAAAAPHGNRLAFTSNDDTGAYHLWVQAGNGQPKEIAGDTGWDFQANWSPNGNDLVFTRYENGSNDLYVVKANGTGLQRLTNTPGVQEVEPAWSPDGTKIVYHGCDVPSFGNCVVYTINPDGTGTSVVTKTFAAPFTDDFGSMPLEEFWYPQVTGTGPTIQQTNGRLELTVPASTMLDPSTGYAMPAVFSRCNLRGDFDFQVDYSLLQWPMETNNVLAAVTEGNFIGGTWTSADGLFVSKWGVSGNFPGLPAPFVPGALANGTLRMARSGSTLTSSYNVDGTWHTLQTRDDLVADESDATLYAFVNLLPTASGDVTVAFDNFRVNSGTFACPSWWDDSAPDWQAR